MTKKLLLYGAIGLVIIGIIVAVIQIQFSYLPKGRIIKGRMIQTEYGSGWGIVTNDWPRWEFSADRVDPNFQHKGLNVECNMTKGEVWTRLSSNQEVVISNSTCTVR